MCLDKVTVRNRTAKKDMEVSKAVEIDSNGKEIGCYSKIEFRKNNKSKILNSHCLGLLTISDYTPGFHSFLDEKDAVAYMEREFSWIKNRKFKVVNFIIPKGSKLTYGTIEIIPFIQAKIVVSDRLINPRASKD